MNPARSAYRRSNQGRKWLCPPDKRVSHRPNDLESRQLPVVLYSGNQFERRGGFFMNHDSFEWLHQNVKSTWYAALTSTFFYLDDRRSIGFYFEDEDDAVLFHMALKGGKLLANYATVVAREHELQRMRSSINGLSMSKRQTAYPGLDDFLLANYPAPAPGNGW